MITTATTGCNPARDYSGANSIAEVTGRGGTDMVTGIEAALELKPRPDLVICLVGAVDERVRGTLRTGPPPSSKGTEYGAVH